MKDSPVFLKSYIVGNIAKKGLHEEGQNKFSKRKLPPLGIELMTSWYLL